ncbi:hypothetical protein BRD00_08535 [Halobacteriales archaeon QS_8_69_26]|nr:MAG: hypothetical protein BRD00_08535 [Halobacteriales archaeon QS_8_69_26]
MEPIQIDDVVEQLEREDELFDEFLRGDRDTSAYPRLPVSDECSDALSEPRSEQAGVERTP